MTPLLFSPYKIRSLELRNRIVVSPMCQYSSEDGFANDWHLVHLGSRAVGGAAVVFTEAAAVSPEGRIAPQDLGIWKDEHIDELARITSFIEARGSIPAIQLAHAGRKASTTPPWLGDSVVLPDAGGWQAIGPTDQPFHAGAPAPVAMDQLQIDTVIRRFREATLRALRAGFKIVEVHAAHGYLIHEFLSPITNTRSDAYGGSFENRCRLLLQIVAAVREVWPHELPVFVRISATDWTPEGWQSEDSVRLSYLLADAGVDLVDCSTGAIAPGIPIPAGPGYQVPFAAAVRSAGMPSGAVGIIVNAQQAEDILQRGEADLIFMARELLRDPYFPLRAARELGYDAMPWPVQYERAKRTKRS